MNSKHLLLILSGFSIIFFSGCAKQNAPAVFYPPEPAAPRIQHLKTFTSDMDFKSEMLKNIIGTAGGYRLGRAFGVAFGEDKIYVVDTGKSAPGIAIFNLKKEKLIHMSGPLRKPIDIAIDDRNFKYVTDSVLRKIVVFDANDAYLKTYSYSDEINPAGITFTNGKLYVTNISIGTVWEIDAKSGDLIRKFGEDRKMFWPAKAALSPVTDQLLVAQTGAAVVSAFDIQGDHLEDFGKPGDAPGNFVRPKSIAVDKDGNIYVVDVAFQNIQVFNKDYQVLMDFGGVRRGGLGLVMPAGIAIDNRNISYFQKYAAPGFTIEYLIAVTSQGTPSSKLGHYASVDIYGFGKKAGADYSQ